MANKSRSNPKKSMLIPVMVALIAAAGVSGYFIGNRKQSKEPSKQTTTQETSPPKDDKYINKVAGFSYSLMEYNGQRLVSESADKNRAIFATGGISKPIENSVDYWLEIAQFTPSGTNNNPCYPASEIAQVQQSKGGDVTTANGEVIDGYPTTQKYNFYFKTTQSTGERIKPDEYHTIMGIQVKDRCYSLHLIAPKSLQDASDFWRDLKFIEPSAN